jgi:alkyl hydroperoxide reductase subunit D
MILENETLNNLAEDLGVEVSELSPALVQFAETGHRYLKDLRINLKNALGFAQLSRKESLMIAFAVAVNDRTERHIEILGNLARNAGMQPEEEAEIKACVSLLNINNVFYRFRHFTQKEYYQQTPAGIKMSIMMQPVLGKEFFELLSLCISALNGCEMCVNAHEQALIQAGTSEARIYDAMRCAAIFRSLTVLPA